MSFIKERSNFSNIIRHYHIQSISNQEEAVRWLCNVKDLPEINPNYFYFSDSMNRMDEGNTSIHLDPEISLDKMLNELSNREIDHIIVNAEFEDKPVVIGIDLHDYKITVLTRKKKMADIIMLEKLLKLSDE